MAIDDPFAWPIDPSVYVCRVKYAAFLYDALMPKYGHAKAVGLAAREAKVTCEAVRQILPTHRRHDRILRNYKILKMRSWGYSIEMIAETFDLNRCTVTRSLDEFRSRMNALEKVARYKIKGRLKRGDPRLSGLPEPYSERLH